MVSLGEGGIRFLLVMTVLLLVLVLAYTVLIATGMMVPAGPETVTLPIPPATVRQMPQPAFSIAAYQPVRPVAEAELRSADEILIASAGGGIRAVISLDGKPVADGRPGPVFRAIRAGFLATLQEFSTALPA